MPAPTPKRTKDVYFLGAGVSCALGLPNTPSLIEAVISFSKEKPWLQNEDLPNRLDKAFEYFYPDAVHEGFRPDVVDFFSTLKTYIDIGTGLVGGFKDAPDLYRQLKFAIAHLLVERTRAAQTRFEEGHSFLHKVVAPGNIVITSNWDLIVELYAREKQIPVRLDSMAGNDLVLLKLHGSVDWCLNSDRDSRYGAGSYASLLERLFPPNPYRRRLPSAQGELVRIKAVEFPNEAWRRIRSRADELYMVTMARGKSGDLGPLSEVWRLAYGALSRAKNLHIVGYSMPEDDIEIRTLLRSGVWRGTKRPRITVKNPAPDVHDRLRKYLSREVVSDYLPIETS